MRQRAAFLVLLAGGLIVVAAGVRGRAQGRTAPADSPTAPAEQHQAVLNKYCITCHNQRMKTGGLVLEGLDLADAPAAADIWEKVVRKLRGGLMPPVRAPRPDSAAIEALTVWLETTLDTAAARRPDPGRPSIHRLNRVEYANAVRDLLALDVDTASLLPPDDASYGFDNIGEVLTMTPGLLDRYLLAARKISRLAVSDPTLRPSTATHSVPISLIQDVQASDDLPFGTRGGLVVRHTFPLDGTYSVRLRLQKGSLASGGGVRGLDEENQIDVWVDGERVARLVIGGQAGNVMRPPGDLASADADATLEARFATKAGTHEVGVAFVDRFYYMEGLAVSRLPAGSDGFAAAFTTTTGYGKIQAAIESIALAGPFDVDPSDDTPSRRRIFDCRPSSRVDEDTCARRILSTLARRAYRRPTADEDLRVLMAFYKDGRARGTFDRGIQAGLERILVAPSFLFRVEEDPPNLPRGAAYRISDVELASRLSFFLWSSIPDEPLLAAAERGQLKDPGALELQVRRMMSDPKANALVRNFFGQWLLIRNMDAVKPDTYAFPDFDDNLREAFKQETELFIESQLREDRSVLDLLRADYTFLNERLARHYGIPGVYGPHFRRVTLPDGHRGGILGQGSILTVTSYANRTSPVIRGKWMLETLLGTPPPAPPATVPGLEESNQAAATRPKTMREQMENHRRNPVCASCHAQMDPLGFALENFDGIGKYRESDGGARIDIAGAFPSGARFANPDEFRRGLLARSDEIFGAVTEKLLTYALGRGVEPADMPVVRAIRRESSQHEYRWSSLILGIVNSRPFQMRRTES
ncbi:MAG TPA: DUF1592 domain-containing protein [Vicinamibacterales bacterium]|nr:DUF1592 domain-containing protein [Vicinamibacterales bacterium]